MNRRKTLGRAAMLLAAAGAAGAQSNRIVVAEEGFRRGTDPVGAFAVPERNRRLVSGETS
jgi:hypothetical protein